jgi:hypothetical protein
MRRPKAGLPCARWPMKIAKTKAKIRRTFLAKLCLDFITIKHFPAPIGCKEIRQIGANEPFIRFLAASYCSHGNKFQRQHGATKALKSAPERIRTTNLLIRSQMLYPVELRAPERAANLRRKTRASNKARQQSPRCSGSKRVN